jgi:tetratricopeptide (TPR) repeat protein
MSAKGQGPFCPECRKPATGNFCQSCGAKLGGRFCNQCGAKLSGGANFCNQCGAKAGGGSAGSARREAARGIMSGSNLAWWIAGAAMFVLIMVLGVQMVRPAGPGAPAAAPAANAPFAGGAAGSGAPPDLSQMTPMDAATRLFNRVMTAISQGDSAQAQAFLPMAIGAYERARPLDHDALFHLSMLNRTALNLDAALDNAEEILAQDPDHLLALAAAAEAAIELGYEDEAAEHYRRILDVYDQELQRGLEEYAIHSAIVDVLKEDAERYLASR